MDSQIPEHIAIVMDGNGRWAKQKKLPRTAGHKAGLETVKRIIAHCIERNIKVLTLFAFSSENWKRPGAEVNALMELFAFALDREVNHLDKNNVRLRIIGELTALSDALQARMLKAVQRTAKNKGLTVAIAVNYGGRWDIQYAVQKILAKVEQQTLQRYHVDEQCIADHLSLSDLSDPDLFIRTAGEQRISNFLLWQLAYTELYFSPVYWPDFNEADLDQALLTYSQRHRRFGKTAEQVDNDA